MTDDRDQRPINVDPILDQMRIDRKDKQASWRRPLKDTDSYSDAEHFRVNVASILFSLLLAGLAAAGAHVKGYSMMLAFIMTFVIMMIVFQVLARHLPEFLGGAGASLYAPTGSSTPAPRQYSLAQSLEVRGQFDAAIGTYADASKEHPDDPEPMIRIARILRDSLQRDEEAAQWFRKARAAEGLSEGQDMMIAREVCELYMFKLKTPERAAPELARLSQKYPGTAAGEWARAHLKSVKDGMQ